MNIEELRIGNYVQDAKGQIREVKGIDGYSSPFLWLKIPLCNLAIGRHGVDDCKPIPLSEELLLKCGFVHEIDEDVIDYYYLKLDNSNSPNNSQYCCHELCIDTKFFMYSLLGFERDSFIHVPQDIKYLHQLQNLYFSLVGEELEVKF